MKKSFLLKSAFLFSFMMGFAANAETQLNNVQINYSRLHFPVDRQGFAIPQAIIGGKVNYTGDAPVYVTVKIANQSYTQVADQDGNYSFFVFAANANSFSVEAWTAAGSSVIPNSSKAKSIIVNKKF